MFMGLFIQFVGLYSRSFAFVGGGVKMLLARRFENVAPCRAADAKTATGF